MKPSCAQIREEIAWGKQLSEEVQSHILSCQVCSETAMEFSILDATFDQGLDSVVPDGFAERVMIRIQNENDTQSRNLNWSLNWAWMKFKPVQVGFMYASFIFTCLCFSSKVW